MFCEKCGNEVVDTDKFCQNCGNLLIDEETQEITKSRYNNEVMLEIKPTTKLLAFIDSKLLITGILLLSTLLYALFNTMPATEKLLGSGDPMAKTVVLMTIGVYLIPIVGIFIAIFVKAFIKKKQNKKITYTFYPDRVIFKDSFLNKVQHELKYKHVREVASEQTFIQRLFKIGSIKLSSNSEGIDSGLVIRDIEDIDCYYKTVKELINP